ncbi:MAG: HIT domain-containing protein [Desulfuromonadales bacterium]|jgi:ATP adenylyltransferase
MERLWAPWRLEYIQAPDHDGCIFCLEQSRTRDAEKLVLTRGESCVVMMNRYPYTNGHLLLAPCRHLGDPAQLTNNEVLELHHWLVDSQTVLRQTFAAEAFNVGWNFGAAAGAGIAAHIHMHVVPRWAGDHNFMPVLADIRVIPEHLERTYEQLVTAFADL